MDVNGGISVPDLQATATSTPSPSIITNASEIAPNHGAGGSGGGLEVLGQAVQSTTTVTPKAVALPEPAPSVPASATTDGGSLAGTGVINTAVYTDFCIQQ